MILLQMYPTIVPYCVPLIKWEKIDKDQYRDIVTASIAEVDQKPTTLGALDSEIHKHYQVLVKASEQSGPELS